MKKLRFLLVLALAAALLAPAALADVIVEPVGDSFYNAHRSECQYLPRSYTANGGAGYLTLYASPVSSREVENLANGVQFSSSYLYTDEAGDRWCALWDARHDGFRGWARLADCLAVPDYISFEEAHGAEFTGFDSAYANALDGVDTVVLWAYPGSDRVVSSGVDAQWFLNSGSLADYFSTCYTDPEGNFWGYVGYCYGIRNTWLCFSAPSDAALEAIADIVPLQEEIPPVADVPATGDSVTTLALVLVAIVAAGTAILIPVLFRKQKRI